jgi:hypothetical protein
MCLVSGLQTDALSRPYAVFCAVGEISLKVACRGASVASSSSRCSATWSSAVHECRGRPRRSSIIRRRFRTVLRATFSTPAAEDALRDQSPAARDSPRAMPIQFPHQARRTRPVDRERGRDCVQPPHTPRLWRSSQDAHPPGRSPGRDPQHPPAKHCRPDPRPRAAAVPALGARHHGGPQDFCCVCLYLSCLQLFYTALPRIFQTPPPLRFRRS